MAQSLSDVLLHIVFSTKNRLSLIRPDIEAELYSYINSICRHLECPLITINGMSDHIHILLQLGKSSAISKIISEIKSNSSRWIKTKGEYYKEFSWQAGYGVFSVSRPNIDGVIKYISSQKEHHKKVTFQDELVEMLQRSQIEYNEKYLWD